jgi:4-amino-4-deoxy-L-arabinose transferase-like glycosyltransferase
VSDRTDAPAPHGPSRVPILLPLLAVALICLLRAAILPWPALSDNTESRHAVIALNMQSNGDWVTPRFFYEGRWVPFWAKPPLLFWVNAASFALLGASEWSARLPGYLAGLAMLAMTFFFARRFWGREVAALATLVLSSTLLFFGLAGSVTVDIVLSASATAAMAAFACFAEAPTPRARRLWGLAFALALALGMLSKGPIAVALAVLSVLVWLGVTRRWRLLATYPWVTGVALFLVVAGPWFVMAERATPGFAKYYFINEHILRYVSHNYGDLYGSGHTKPYGAVWPLLAVAVLPWTVVLGGGVAARVLRRRPTDPRMAYLLAWGLVPAVFFTFARQLIVTYLLPGFAALAVAAAVVLAERDESGPDRVTVWLLRIQGLVWAAVLAGGCVWATSAGVSRAVPVALAVLAALTVAATVVWRRRVAPMAVVQAVVAAAFVVTAVAGFRAQFDDGYSTKTVISRVAGRADLVDRELVFPYAEESSAELYARILLGRSIRHVPRQDGNALVRQLVAAHSSDLVVISRRHWKRAAPDALASLEVVLETGSWVACVVPGAPAAVPR